MKQNITIIVLAILILTACGKEPDTFSHPSNTSSDFVETVDADEEVEAPNSESIGSRPALLTNPIAAARNYATQLLHRASENGRLSQASAFFTKMQQALKDATIRIARSGKSFKECVQDPNVLAFVMSNKPNTIHVCPRAAGADLKSLAQVLIHETAHVVGIHDECQATKVEVVAMRGAGTNLAFKNGYMSGCGFRDVEN